MSRAEEFKMERARGTEQCLSGAGESKLHICLRTVAMCM